MDTTTVAMQHAADLTKWMLAAYFIMGVNIGLLLYVVHRIVKGR